MRGVNFLPADTQTRRYADAQMCRYTDTQTHRCASLHAGSQIIINKLEINRIAALQKAYYQTGKTFPVTYRIQALKKLKNTIKLYEKDIFEALSQDLGKSNFERKNYFILPRTVHPGSSPTLCIWQCKDSGSDCNPLFRWN